MGYYEAPSARGGRTDPGKRADPFSESEISFGKDQNNLNIYPKSVIPLSIFGALLCVKGSGIEYYFV